MVAITSQLASSPDFVTRRCGDRLGHAIAGAVLAVGGIVAGVWTPIGIRERVLTAVNNSSAGCPEVQPSQHVCPAMTCCGNLTVLGGGDAYSAMCWETDSANTELYCYRSPRVVPMASGGVYPSVNCPVPTDPEGALWRLDVSQNPDFVDVVCEVQRGSVARAILPTQLGVAPPVISEMQALLDQISVTKGKKFACSGVGAECAMANCMGGAYYWHGVATDVLAPTGLLSGIMLREVRPAVPVDLDRCCASTMLRARAGEDPVMQAYRTHVVCGQVDPINLAYDLKGLPAAMAMVRDQAIEDCMGGGYNAYGELVTTTTSTTTITTTGTATTTATDTTTGTTTTVTDTTTGTTTTTTATITTTTGTTTTTLVCCVDNPGRYTQSIAARDILSGINSGSTGAMQSCVAFAISGIEFFCANDRDNLALLAVLSVYQLSDPVKSRGIGGAYFWLDAGVVVGPAECRAGSTCLRQDKLYRYSMHRVDREQAVGVVNKSTLINTRALRIYDATGPGIKLAILDVCADNFPTPR